MIGPFQAQAPQNPVQSTVQASNQSVVGGQSNDVDEAAPKDGVIQPRGTALADSNETETSSNKKEFSSSSSTSSIEQLVEKGVSEDDSRTRGSLLDQAV